MKTRIFILGATIALLAMALVFGLSSFTPQESNSGYLIMICRKTNSNITDNSILIIDEQGNDERIKLKKHTGSNKTDNFKMITEKLNELKNKGYKLVATSGDFVEMQYIFEK